MKPLTQPVQQRARTKIVATVGPACATRHQLGELISAGTDVFRINMAHGDRQQHESLLTDIRWASHQQERPIGILIDLAGPKIRLGQLVVEPLACAEGATFRFVRGDQSSRADELTTNYDLLLDELSEGDRILLADGTVGMKVTAKNDNEVHCEVVIAGELRSRQGVNLPGVKLSVPAMTQRDRDNAEWAAASAVDFVSLSFVRSATEVRELSGMLRARGSRALVIAKIEKPEALENLDEIVAAAGGIMVARGDLGVEIDVAETPVAQKRIIDACTRHRKPVIVATQMLDSMQHSRRPTRAEVSDVANAILDGSDACMLSGETAIGDYPRESVEMMNRIMLSTEGLTNEATRRVPASTMDSAVHPITAAVVHGAGQIADKLQAKLVVIATRSGRTALVKAKQRDFIPTLGVSDSEETLRQMTLLWGIEPIRGAPEDIGPGLLKFIDEWGRRNRILNVGDRVVLVAGTGYRTGAHNRVEVHEVT